MLVSSLALNVVATVVSVVVGAFGGILFDFFYYNYSSDYIIEPTVVPPIRFCYTITTKVIVEKNNKLIICHQKHQL